MRPGPGRAGEPVAHPSSVPTASGARVADALAVPCSRCEAAPGQRCMAVCDYARKPHAERRRLALAHAAHADPFLDAFFRPGSRTCGMCGTPGLPQRHRAVDAIAGSLAAGEVPEVAAEEYGVSEEAVHAVAEWMTRWPGAWK